MDDYEITITLSDQIVRDVFYKIANGDLKIGDKLPSVREMATKWSVSPDTIQRAYSQLEQISLIETKRGLGTFICNNENLIRHFRTKYVFQKIDSFVKEIKEIGMPIDEIIAYLKFKYAKTDNLCIEDTEDAKMFISEFEKYAEIDENGRYSITFRNNIDYIDEKISTTFFKSDDKWYFYDYGETWLPLKAKEMPKITPFILKYSKPIIEAISKKEDKPKY